METEPYKRIAEVFYLTGYQIKLRPMESIQKVKISDDLIAVLINAVEAAESTTKFTVRRTGRRLISWERRPNGSWFRDDMTEWDEAKPDIIHFKHGSAELSDAARAEHLDWEQACHRPGTSRVPLDAAEAADSAKMYRHWKMEI